METGEKYVCRTTVRGGWFDSIPSHWKMVALREVLKLRNEKNDPVQTEQILSLSIAHGVTLYSDRGRGGNKRKGDLCAYKIAREGDIVLNSMNVIVGAVGLSRYTGAISPVYYALYPAHEGVDIKYYAKVFDNVVFQRYLRIYGKGILIKETDAGKLNTIRMKISPGDLKGVLLPLPPREEQETIAAWLRAQDARIARFVQGRRALAKLLAEQKTALISHAVTRGVPNSGQPQGVAPTVNCAGVGAGPCACPLPRVYSCTDSGRPQGAAPTKPSGVPWLGDVPEHWEVQRLKSLVSNITEQTETQADDEVYLALEHVQSWTGIAKPPTGKVEFASMVKKFSCGDILFGKLRPYLAKVTKAYCKGVCVSEFLVLRPCAENVLPTYLEQLLRSKPVIDLIDSSTAGAKMPRAEWSFIGNVRLPVPPLVEQHAICQWIAEQCRPLDAAIASIEKEIALVLEYRQRQILDAVTGQIDLRGWQPGPGDVVDDAALAALGNENEDVTEEEDENGEY